MISQASVSVASYQPVATPDPACTRHQSDRFDQRPWYTALLEHKDTQIKVLAYAAMRKTKPEDWLTATPLASMPAAQSTCGCSCRSLSALRRKRAGRLQGRLKVDTAAAEAAPARG